MSAVDTLLKSEEPAIRWKVRTRVLGEPEDGREVRRLRAQIRRSPRVALLLSEYEHHRDVYAKWLGAHWVLAALADLGYPPGDEALAPMGDRVVTRWLDEHFYQELKGAAYGQRGVRLIAGRYRRCASQQGNALRCLTALGLLADADAGRLVERLRHWQWPDGGWNCDRNPAADTSSFYETLLPMRGLARHDPDAARRAAEVFLTRRLLYRRSTGELIHRDFARLHHPLYWHYDLLGGLVGLMEVGVLDDPRCADALDLLESKRLPDGGWPAEGKYYRATPGGGRDIDWGGTNTRRTNEWVTADALAVLAAAGRLRP